MWKVSATVSLISLLLATVQAEHNNFVTEYSIAASNTEGPYYYPAPPKALQLHEPFAPQEVESSVTQTYQNEYKSSYRSPYTMQQSSFITNQFVSPSLDNIAFILALTQHGYKNAKARTFSNAFTASPRSSKTNLQTSASPSLSSTSSPPVLGSLNVKLPLPFGVTPLNIAPLPLEAGSSYSNSVTSYGTIYPQRK